LEEYYSERIVKSRVFLEEERIIQYFNVEYPIVLKIFNEYLSLQSSLTLIKSIFQQEKMSFITILLMKIIPNIPSWKLLKRI